MFVVAIAFSATTVQAKTVKYCETLCGAIANARFYKTAIAEEPIPPDLLEQSKKHCFDAQVTERLKVVRKEQATVSDELGQPRKLEAYIWFIGDSAPVLIRYYHADAYLDGTLVLADFLLKLKQTVPESEYKAAKEAAKQAKDKDLQEGLSAYNVGAWPSCDD